MWLRIVLSVGVIGAVVAGVRLLVRRRSHRQIEVGAVSDSWLAEQRGSEQER